MRTLAKISVVTFTVVLSLIWKYSILVLLFWPYYIPFAMPIAWYVLFTLPEERAREFEILRCLATREPTP